MRYNRVIVASGTLRTNAFGMRQAVVLAVVGAALIWAGIAFAQEAYIGHRLNQQVADLRNQNVVLAAQNRGYKKDVQAITSGTADEEEGAKRKGDDREDAHPTPLWCTAGSDHRPQLRWIGCRRAPRARPSRAVQFIPTIAGCHPDSLARETAAVRGSRA